MTKIEIKGMSCNHCVMGVTRTLTTVPGVERVEVSLDRGEATIEGPADPAALVAAVQDDGYEAKVLS